jgi:hypothetical protein
METISIAPSEANEGSSAGSWVITLLPLAFLVVFFVVFLRLLKRTDSSRRRALEHMDRMEAKTDRMVELLESIQKQLQR